MPLNLFYLKKHTCQQADKHHLLCHKRAKKICGLRGRHRIFSFERTQALEMFQESSLHTRGKFTFLRICNKLFLLSSEIRPSLAIVHMHQLSLNQ